ncbi:MAG: hypothetical protein KME50_38420 [Nostoc desertorum CM1-VF14]|jgi:hypothetical protein|nr:hypothetical protein [Nostoc desertorum CM1-VF14]
MKILEQTEDVLTLQNPARDFWFGMIFLLFGSPPAIVLFAMNAMSGGWWGFLYLLVVTGGFCLALQQIWASDVVKVCSFNKALSKVTVKYHGLQTKIKDFPLQDVRRVEVRHRIGFAYGCAFEGHQLWLVTRNFNRNISLSEEGNNKASLEALANRVREFLI